MLTTGHMALMDFEENGREIAADVAADYMDETGYEPQRNLPHDIREEVIMRAECAVDDALMDTEAVLGVAMTVCDDAAWADAWDEAVREEGDCAPFELVACKVAYRALMEAAIDALPHYLTAY